MTALTDNMTFGTFMALFHRVGENPTLALERDLELIEWPDDLGFDEAWIGEHHSGGWETIASPEVFIATAARRTRHIRLGTGIVSLPCHHPYMVANRMVLLDHLTRGRVMLGVGPGALASDVKAGAERAGRRIQDIDMPQMMAVAMSQDAEAARNTARYAVAMYMGQQPHISKTSGVGEEVIQQIHDTMGGWPPRGGGIESAMSLVGDDIVELLCAAGTPEMRRRGRLPPRSFP